MTKLWSFFWCFLVLPMVLFTFLQFIFDQMRLCLSQVPLNLYHTTLLSTSCRMSTAGYTRKYSIQALTPHVLVLYKSLEKQGSSLNFFGKS